MEEENRLHYTYLLKNLPTCLATLFENEKLEKERSRKVAVALMTCFTVYNKKYGFREIELRNFRTKQIVQIYESLLSLNIEYVKSPEVWQEALMLEANREEKFIMNTMTATTRQKFGQLMQNYGVPSERWYLFLNLLLNVQTHMKVLSNGHIQLPPGNEIEDIVNIICKDEIDHTQAFTYSLLARLQTFYSIRQIVKVLIK